MGFDKENNFPFLFSVSFSFSGFFFVIENQNDYQEPDIFQVLLK